MILAFSHSGLVVPDLQKAIAFDLPLLASLFVRGADFWDKLRSLFSHDATVVITKKPSGSGVGR